MAGKWIDGEPVDAHMHAALFGPTRDGVPARPAASILNAATCSGGGRVETGWMPS